MRHIEKRVHMLDGQTRCGTAAWARGSIGTLIIGDFEIRFPAFAITGRKFDLSFAISYVRDEPLRNRWRWCETLAA